MTRAALRRAGLLGALGGLLLLLLPSPVRAEPAPAPAAPRLQVRRIDSADPTAVQVAFEYDGDPGSVGSLKATENGKALTDIQVKKATDAGLTNNVVFVVDSSQSTDVSAVLAEARSAISSLAAALPGTQMALVTAGSDVALVHRFTPSADEITQALSTITPAGDGALWGGVERAAAELAPLERSIPTIVLVTDGNSGKGVSYDDAKGAVNAAGAAVFTLAVADADGGLDGNPRALAQESGGTYQETAKPSDLTTLAAGLKAPILGQYAYTYASNQPAGVNDVTLDLGGATTKSSYVTGSTSVGVTALAYQAPATRSGFQPLQNSFGKLLAVVLGVVAVCLAAYAVLGALVKDDKLEVALEPYSEGYTANRSGDDGDGRQGMATTQIMQRAVDLTAQLADRQGLLTKVESALERADLPLRAAEAIFFYGAAVLVLSLLVAFLVAPLAGVILLAVTVLAAPAILNLLSERRRRAFEAQLPDTLQLLSGTLRAGYSMMQGVEAVSQEVADPIGRELRRVVTEARLGRQLEDSLDAVAERMGSNDFRWATMAIRIQREVGGNLSELLMTVAETMTERERLRRDVKSLTAEGRMSAYVLAVLPPAIGLIMWTLNPDYSAKLTDSAFGLTLLGIAAALMVGGFLWMNRIVKIDV